MIAPTITKVMPVSNVVHLQVKPHSRGALAGRITQSWAAVMAGEGMKPFEAAAILAGINWSPEWTEADLDALPADKVEAASTALLVLSTASPNELVAIKAMMAFRRGEA